MCVFDIFLGIPKLLWTLFETKYLLSIFNGPEMVVSTELNFILVIDNNFSGPFLMLTYFNGPDFVDFY